MQMIAQIKQLLPSTGNITAQTKKSEHYYHIYIHTIPESFFFFFFFSAASTFTLLPWVIFNFIKIQLVVYY